MIRTLLGWLLLCLACTCLQAEVVEPFHLPDTQGATVEVAPGDQPLTVVCFLGTECPLAKLYAPRLSKLAAEFPTVKFLGVNSNVQDSSDDLRAYAESLKLPFPMLKDHRNELADRFGAERTPEVFVLDPQFTIRYRGRIDDQYKPGLSRKQPTQQELRQAIQSLLAGEDVLVPRTDAVGCIIGRVREPIQSSDVTYCKQIAGILQQHCIECHREGEIGPFQLDEYDEVVGWADMMLEVIDDGRMPPWHANPAHGSFENARNLPDKDKQTLQRWVDAGMPYGDAHDLPEPAQHTQGWRLPREPDVVIAMSQHEFPVPADGTVEYQYFVVDPGFTEDKWITGAQIVPGNPGVVHHSIVFVRPPDGAPFRGIGWLTSYVPGSRMGSFPPASAVKVPAKSKLVFQQHYTPNGHEQSDITKLGLTFGKDEEITNEIYTLVGIDQEFEIPPHASNHVVRADVRYLPRNATLLTINPHMHVRGKSFRCFANMGDEKITLLDVPKYDFNWQHAYRLTNPLPFASIKGLDFEVAFDNSSENPVNPDPTEYVTWGDQTWEEMAVAFFEVTEPRVKPRAKEAEVVEQSEAQTKPLLEKVISAELQAKMSAEADRMLAKFDKNNDGLVGKYETPLAFRRYAFRWIDRDGDSQLTRAEIERAAEQKVR